MPTLPATPITPPAPPVTIPQQRRLARRAKRLLRFCLIAYLLVGLVLYLFQTKLIFPGASTQGTKDALVDRLPHSQLLHLTAADGKTPIVALFGKAQLQFGGDDPRSPTLPTVLFFYGNAMCLADAIFQFDLFRNCGANCIAVEYEGYGMSGGTPGEQGCYAAAEAAYQYLLTRPDIDPHKLVPAGWSLGGAVAIDLAWKHRTDHTIAALITFCSFTSMPDMAHYHYPFFPTSLILQHRFASEEKLRDLPIPYFLGHGQKDSMIPFTQANRLAAAYPGTQLTRFTSPTANHNDFFEVTEKQLPPALTKFLQQISLSTP